MWVRLERQELAQGREPEPVRRERQRASRKTNPLVVPALVLRP
jgi:hypothetical protein